MDYLNKSFSYIVAILIYN